MKENTKQMLDQFQGMLEENNLGHFITYLIDRDLITPSAVRHYTIIHEFETLRKEHPKKSKLVNRLSDKYHIAERTVWTILRKVD